jgi:hypothetical protein
VHTPRSHTQSPEHRHLLVEAIMDEEALQAPNSIRPNHRALYTVPVVRSPKSEEPLSALGDPLAHSMAQDVITEGTGFVAALSHASN